MSKITNDLGGRSDLDDITTKGIGFNVLLFDIDPLRTESELGSLELEIGVLSTISFIAGALESTHPPGIS